MRCLPSCHIALWHHHHRARAIYAKLQSTTIGAIVAAGVFFAAYSGSVRQLRHIPVMKSTGEGGTWTSLPSQSPRNIKTFKDFISAVAPSVLLHSQGLAVATVFSGLAGGAVDGHLAEQGQQERDSRDKNSG